MKSRGAATTTHFADLPEDVLTRILTEVPVTLLPRTLVALRLTCHQSDTILSNCEGMWHALSRRVEEGDDSSSDASPAAAPTPPLRSSAFLQSSPTTTTFVDEEEEEAEEEAAISTPRRRLLGPSCGASRGVATCAHHAIRLDPHPKA